MVAAIEFPLLDLLAAGQYADAYLSARPVFDAQPAALLMAVDRRRIGHPGPAGLFARRTTRQYRDRYRKHGFRHQKISCAEDVSSVSLDRAVKRAFSPSSVRRNEAPLPAAVPKSSVVTQEPRQHVRRKRGRTDLFAMKLAVHGRVPLQIRFQDRR
jgi:hypothetical protein